MSLAGRRLWWAAAAITAGRCQPSSDLRQCRTGHGRPLGEQADLLGAVAEVQPATISPAAFHARFVRGRAPVLLRAGAMRANGVRATAGGGESSLWQDAELLARHGEASVHWQPGKKEERGATPTAGRLADFPSRYREDEL